MTETYNAGQWTPSARKPQTYRGTPFRNLAPVKFVYG